MENENKDYVELPVTGGYVTKVDSDIAEKLHGKKIFLSKQKYNSYPSIWFNGKNLKLSRYVLNAKKGDLVDHISGDTFDNRKSNLRFTSYSINRINKHASIKNLSGFIGVVFRNDTKKYRTILKYKNQRFRYQFSNKFIAAIHRDILVSQIIKIKVRKNFENEINDNSINDFINNTSGKIFKICFVKRSDGSFREMICRSGVSKNINGKGMAFEPGNSNLSVVYDMQNKSYKCIPLENIVCMKFQNNNYLVTRKRLVA